MDNYRGDGSRELERARLERNINRKIDLLIDAMRLMIRELRHMFGPGGKEGK